MSLKDTLICAVCDSIYHNAVALLDCNHHFCGACISRWFKESSTCPVCRKTARKAVPGHTIQQVVEFYLEGNPSEKRTPREIRNLDRVYRAGDEVQVRHGRDPPPTESDDEDEDSDDEGIPTPLTATEAANTARWWEQAGNAMDSNEDLTAFIQQQAEEDERRRRELLGETTAASGSASRQNSTGQAGQPNSRRDSETSRLTMEDDEETLLWEPCKHCHSPSPLPSPIAEKNPGFTCPEPLGEVFEYPAIKGLVIQQHAKCKGCYSTFPIVDENEPDYICKLCDEYWCGNVDNCSSGDFALVNCAAKLDFLKQEFVEDIIGHLEMNIMINWMFDDVLWDDSLDWPTVGKMIVDDQMEQDGLTRLLPNTEPVDTDRTWSCTGCMKKVIQKHLPAWWAAKKEEFKLDDPRPICTAGYDTCLRQVWDSGHREEFNHFAPRQNLNPFATVRNRPQSQPPTASVLFTPLGNRPISLLRAAAEARSLVRTLENQHRRPPPPPPPVLRTPPSIGITIPARPILPAVPQDASFSMPGSFRQPLGQSPNGFGNRAAPTTPTPQRKAGGFKGLFGKKAGGPSRNF